MKRCTLVQVIAITGLTALIRLVPSFQFQDALVVLVVALNWGAGPGLLATLVGGTLLLFLLLPPVFSLTIARVEDALGLLIYLGVGCAVSLLAGQVQRVRRSAEQAHRQLDTIQQAMTDAVMVYDGEGQLVLWNAAAEQLPPLQQPDDASHALAERGELFLLRDEQGQPLPVDQWPVQRILNGEVLSISCIRQQSRPWASFSPRTASALLTRKGSLLPPSSSRPHVRLCRARRCSGTRRLSAMWMGRRFQSW